ncbi:MAG: CBS domain-containing protein [Polyangiaceae bacterium]
MLVREIMTESVLTLTPETTLREASSSLATLGVSGAPVCDVRGKIVGVFSKSNVVDQVGNGLDLSQPIGLHMTPGAVTIEASATVEAAAVTMSTEGVHRLIVTDNEKLVGLVSPMDILRAIADGKLRLVDV